MSGPLRPDPRRDAAAAGAIVPLRARVEKMRAAIAESRAQREAINREPHEPALQDFADAAQDALEAMAELVAELARPKMF